MDCWQTLGISPTRDHRVITDAWRRLANISHPDKGGTAEAFHAAKQAYEQALLQGKNVVEIKRTRILAFGLQLKASTVVDPSIHNVEFYDHKQKVIACTVTVPAWRMAWGKHQTLRMENVEVSDRSLVTVDINCQIENDILTWTDTGLVLEPEIPAGSALGTDSIQVNWRGQHEIMIDKYGRGILYYNGYLLEDNSRANLMVYPKYTFR
jgi:hypothetical protein